VYYNGIIINVNYTITTQTFTTPSLPDGVFSGTVVVMVTAISRLGVGPASDPATAEITGNYLHTAMCSCVSHANFNIFLYYFMYVHT